MNIRKDKMIKMICGDCLIEMPKIESKSVQLLIVDPPYYKVRGEFDFIWETFDEYLADVEKWALACKDCLADNGTLFWFGSAKRIAYTQVILDKHFNLINNLVWDKGSFMGLEHSDGLRSFAPCTERLLMYENADKTGSQMIKNNEFLFITIKEYLRKEKDKSGLTLTDLNEILVSKRKSDLIAKRYFGTSQWELPTKEMYYRLQTTGFWEKEYEELRKEYEELRRPFNNSLKLQEVLRFSNEKSKQYNHPTKKSLKLIEALITTCSRENDLVVDPFSGSGTTGEACINTNRNCIMMEKDKKYFEIGSERIKQAQQKLSLFT